MIFPSARRGSEKPEFFHTERGPRPPFLVTDRLGDHETQWSLRPHLFTLARAWGTYANWDEVGREEKGEFELHQRRQ